MVSVRRNETNILLRHARRINKFVNAYSEMSLQFKVTFISFFYSQVKKKKKCSHCFNEKKRQLHRDVL